MRNQKISLNKEFIVKSKLKKYKVKFIDVSTQFIKKIYSKNDLFLIDRNIYKLHNLEKILPKDRIILIKANEGNKSFHRLNIVIKNIIDKDFKKNGKLIVIGGGITQDIASFISSIIFRGVDWVFIPTSFLSQCDSCIGGKTSINFYHKKNQIGNFNPPNNIYIDINFLKTHKLIDIRSGIGEMSHYFFVSNNRNYKKFINFYRECINLNKKTCNDLIYRCLKIKKSFIEKDEFDQNERLILNYGHTFGHAIEGITKNKIPHGLAVANGMDIANFVSYKYGYLDEIQFNNMQQILKDIYGDNKPKNLNVKNYISYLKKDKKNKNHNLRAVLTKGVGKMFLKEIKFDSKFIKILEKYKELYL